MCKRILTKQQELDIIEMLKNNTQQKVAEKYKISQQLVSLVKFRYKYNQLQQHPLLNK